MPMPSGYRITSGDVYKRQVLHRGTPIYVDFEAMSAAVCKTAKVLKGGTTTAPRVAKGHYFVAGDVVMKLGVTDKSPIIKSIDTANAGYDAVSYTHLSR